MKQNDQKVTSGEYVAAAVWLMLAAVLTLPMSIALLFGAAWGWVAFSVLCLASSLRMAAVARQRAKEEVVSKYDVPSYLFCDDCRINYLAWQKRQEKEQADHK